nr:PREDICTED: proto-oncogene vav-like [Paralichthys olivaceus]
MELWRQCAMWLIDCRVLPENHRVTWEGAQVCDLAQALRDGVLLCQLLNNLLPQAVNLREINLRPQMSQFLCLKNIRTFLGVCQQMFHLKKNELFEAFDLFDVRDFAKVIDTLSILSHSSIAIQRRLQPFPSEECATDDEIYSGLSDQIDDTVDEDDDLYDCVEDEENEGDEIYEDLMRTDEQPETQQKAVVDKRECCLQEIRQTEEKYSDTLESILQHFMKPLERFLKDQDIESIFINIEDLADTHRKLLEEVRSSILKYGAKNLYQVFLSYKERLLLYGHYCSQVETATKHLDSLSNAREDIRMKLEECSKRANSGRFSLRDLLMVPIQRVLKYHLLLQELVKHTTDPADKENLRTALDAMRWSHLFLLLDCFGRSGYDLFFKTRELKKKWLEQFQMALSNMCPENSTANNHDFQMHCFEETTSCKACSMLLRGIFFQGYRCTRCKMAAHKECLGRVPACGRSSDHTGTRKNKTQRSSGHSSVGFPKMEVCQEYYGLPPPPVGFGQQLQLSKGDIIELTRAEADLQWWEGRNLTIGQMGWFPCRKVQPYVPRSTPDLSGFNWFAGNMDRTAAKQLLMSRSDGTFLVRQKDGGEFAISIKFNMDIRHIKITSVEGLYRINDKKAFKGLIELVQFYQKNSLKEYFKDVDTNLRTPYKQPEQMNSSDSTPNTTPGGSVRSFGVARARYDFSARDRSELSLHEGDTIKILSKKGHSGWWRGEVYGRVGLFPANYVEEDYSDYC